ncbi:MAG: hypothetical protein ABI758_01635 [Candidatus Woesebacteria bacterium]
MTIKETPGVDMVAEVDASSKLIHQAKWELFYHLTYGDTSYSPAEEERIQTLLRSSTTTKGKTIFPNVEARRQMGKNIKRLRMEGAQIPVSEDFVEALTGLCIQIQLDVLDDEGDKVFIELIANENGGLLAHLQETAAAARDMSARFRELHVSVLSNRQMLLLSEAAAPLHDVIKLLGSPNAQIEADHEHVMAEIFEKIAVGKRIVALGQGDEQILTTEDVRFLAGIVGKHEDVYREEEFAAFTQSFKQEMGTNIDDPIAIERGRMLFHLIDLFGRATDITKEGEFVIVDQEKFKDRYVNLFRRHIKLPIQGSFDWSKGKMFRPLWGLYAEHSVKETLFALGEYGITVRPETIDRIVGSIQNVLVEAKIAIESSGKREELGVEYNEIDRVLREFGDISMSEGPQIITTPDENRKPLEVDQAMTARLRMLEKDQKKQTDLLQDSKKGDGMTDIPSGIPEEAVAKKENQSEETIKIREISKDADLSAVQDQLAELGLIDKETRVSPYNYVLVFNGGAGEMDTAPGGEQDKLIDSLVKHVQILEKAGKNVVMVTGGTDSGYIQVAGKVREKLVAAGIDVQAIGICPGPQIWRGEPSQKPADLELLEPNHTHAILVDGPKFGDETEVFFKVVAALEKNARGERAESLATIYNGGGITVEEVERNFLQNRNMLVVGESGRSAFLLDFLQRCPTLTQFRKDAGIALARQQMEALTDRARTLSTKTLSLIPQFIKGLLNATDAETDEQLEPRYEALHEKAQQLIKIISHDELADVLEADRQGK